MPLFGGSTRTVRRWLLDSLFQPFDHKVGDLLPTAFEHHIVRRMRKYLAPGFVSACRFLNLLPGNQRVILRADDE